MKERDVYAPMAELEQDHWWFVLVAPFLTHINHDVAWYLYSAGRLLDGGRMYQDIFVDVNPPLALYLTVPPVYLARLTGMFSVDIFIAYLCVLMLASLTIMLCSCLSWVRARI